VADSRPEAGGWLDTRSAGPKTAPQSHSGRDALGDYAAQKPPPFDGLARGENGPRYAAPSSVSARTTESRGYAAAPDAAEPSDRHALHAAGPAPYVPAPAPLPLPPEVLQPQGESAARGVGGRLGRALRPFGRDRNANGASQDTGHADTAGGGRTMNPNRSQASGHTEAASGSHTTDRFSSSGHAETTSGSHTANRDRSQASGHAEAASGSRTTSRDRSPGGGHAETASGRRLTRGARSKSGAESRDGRHGEDSTGHDDDHLVRDDRERGASGEAARPKGRRWGRKGRSHDANPETEPAASPAMSAGTEPDAAPQPEGRNTTTPTTRPAHAAPPSPSGQGPVWDDRTPVRGPFAPEPESISPPLPNPEPVTPPLTAPNPVRPRASEKRRTAKQSKDSDYVDWVSGLGSD
jgi:hypothetical protein